MIQSVMSHSGVLCFDFRNNLCYGFGRNYRVMSDVTDGYFDEATENDICNFYTSLNQQFSSIEQMYTTNYPMTKIKKGGELTLIWPARGHATGDQSPRVVELYISKEKLSLNTNQDATNLQKIGESSFSNCDGNNQDSLCKGTFKIPDEFDGIHQLQWVWDRSHIDGNIYKTCGDILIEENSEDVPSPPFDRLPSEPEEPEVGLPIEVPPSDNSTTIIKPGDDKRKKSKANKNKNNFITLLILLVAMIINLQLI